MTFDRSILARLNCRTGRDGDVFAVLVAGFVRIPPRLGVGFATMASETCFELLSAATILLDVIEMPWTVNLNAGGLQTFVAAISEKETAVAALGATTAAEVNAVKSVEVSTGGEVLTLLADSSCNRAK